MPKRKIGQNTPRKPHKVPSFKYENPEFLAAVERLAFEGWYDAEIADELNVSRWEFYVAVGQSEQLSKTLSEARARAKEQAPSIPSPPKFARLWQECGCKRINLIKKLGIRYTTLKSWEAEDPRLTDIMATTDLELLDKMMSTGIVLALGGVKGKDRFAGWSRMPDPYMIRWYLNTLGRKYGYGENPAETTDGESISVKAEAGIDIEKWIEQELSSRPTDPNKDDNQP